MNPFGMQGLNKLPGGLLPNQQAFSFMPQVQPMAPVTPQAPQAPGFMQQFGTLMQNPMFAQALMQQQQQQQQAAPMLPQQGLTAPDVSGIPNFSPTPLSTPIARGNGLFDGGLFAGRME